MKEVIVFAVGALVLASLVLIIVLLMLGDPILLGWNRLCAGLLVTVRKPGGQLFARRVAVI